MFHKTVSVKILTIITLMLSTQLVYSFPWNYDMWEQPAIQPYEQPVIYPDKSVTRDGEKLEPGERTEIEEITTNPVPSTTESIKRGEELYDIYCAVCHGENARGNGIIVQKGHGFYPVDLTSQGVAQRTNGYIYAYILYGGKVMMPAYGESISSDGAWHIINYVRSLQENGSNTTAEENEQ